MKKKYSLLWISIIFMMSGAIAQGNTDHSDNLSAVILKIKYKSHMIKGFGGSLILKNIKTGKVYREQFKPGLHSYIKIPGLEEGSYKVEQLIITAGPNRLFVPSTHNCFNDIHIKENAIYFLGNYIVKKIPPTFQYHIRIMGVSQPKEKDILKGIGTDHKIITDQKLFIKNSTDVRIR